MNSQNQQNNMNNSQQNHQMNNSRNNDNQLFVNLAFDMDMFELTKIEPLKRYEENLHLLSKVFSNQEKSLDVQNLKNDKIENKDFSDALQKIYSYINNKQNDKNVYEINDLISNLASSLNNSSNNLENDVDMSGRKNCNEPNTFEELLLNQLKTNLEELNDIKYSFSQKLKNFSLEREKYKSLYNKFKNLKNKDEIMNELNDKNNIIFNDIQLDTLGLNKKEEKIYVHPFKKGEVVSYISL